MEDVLELLSAYQSFSAQGERGDLPAFGAWLQQREHPSVSTNIDVEFEQVATGNSVVQATFLFGRLARYLDHWLRLSFRDVPPVSIGDYAIIKEVEYLSNPTKKTIFERQIMERTTCMESIKRLVRNGILTEEIDPEDRRRRRVRLTEEGRLLAPRLDEKMHGLANLLFGELSEAERVAMIPALKKLMDFHDHLYQHKDKEDIRQDFKL